MRRRARGTTRAARCRVAALVCVRACAAPWSACARHAVECVRAARRGARVRGTPCSVRVVHAAAQWRRQCAAVRRAALHGPPHADRLHSRRSRCREKRHGGLQRRPVAHADSNGAAAAHGGLERADGRAATVSDVQVFL